MANLPDNFSQSAFDARYAPESGRLTDEREYLAELEKALADLGALEDPTDEQEGDMLALEDQIADQRLEIRMLEDA